MQKIISFLKQLISAGLLFGFGLLILYGVLYLSSGLVSEDTINRMKRKEYKQQIYKEMMEAKSMRKSKIKTGD